MAIKIYNIYKEKTIEVVKSNPYQLVEDVEGIGFTTADKIAIKLGIDLYGENRIKAGLVYTLKTASEREGHTYLPKSVLVQSCIEILAFTDAEKTLTIMEKISACLQNFIIKKSTLPASLLNFP